MARWRPSLGTTGSRSPLPPNRAPPVTPDLVLDWLPGTDEDAGGAAACSTWGAAPTALRAPVAFSWFPAGPLWVPSLMARVPSPLSAATPVAWPAQPVASTIRPATAAKTAGRRPRPIVPPGRRASRLRGFITSPHTRQVDHGRP